MDWSKAKHPEVPVVVKKVWARGACNTPTREWWGVCHPDECNGGEGIVNIWSITDVRGNPTDGKVHADAECAKLNAERLQFLKNLPGGQLPVVSGFGTGGLHAPAAKIEFATDTDTPVRIPGLRMRNVVVGANPCWRCGRAINDTEPGWEGDGMMYPTQPPQYAHKVCPQKEAPVPLLPLRLVARHCRSCNTIQLRRGDGLEWDWHYAKGGSGEEDAKCYSRDFGPEVVIAVVPW